MSKYPCVGITQSGAIFLGADVVCDGFYDGASVRVQSHAHADHLTDFDTSKGYQDIVASPATYDLLILLKNADLPYRSNFQQLAWGTSRQFGNSLVSLVPSGHILGSAQIAVERDDGVRYGYSGDFQWPVSNVIHCDTLVLDSTHGNPRYRRNYKQPEVERRLQELLIDKCRLGIVFLRGHTGCLQRALSLVAGSVEVPILASRYTISELEVYTKYGFPLWSTVDMASKDTHAIFENGKGIVLLRMNDRPPPISRVPIKITLSEYISDPKDPVLEFNSNDYRVALSDHADFDGILAYVTQSGAKTVITDNTRGGHGVDLALELRYRLGIKSYPSGEDVSKEWGRR